MISNNTLGVGECKREKAAGQEATVGLGWVLSRTPVPACLHSVGLGGICCEHG